MYLVIIHLINQFSGGSNAYIFKRHCFLLAKLANINLFNFSLKETDFLPILNNCFYKIIFLAHTKLRTRLSKMYNNSNKLVTYYTYKTSDVDTKHCHLS